MDTAIGNVFYYNWEVVLMELMQSYAGTVTTMLASVITMCGEEMVLIAVLGFLYWCYDKEMGKKIGTGLFIGLVLNPMIKNVFLRRRPYFDNPTIKCLKPVSSEGDIYDITSQGYSFPSGHSTNAAAVFGAMAYYIKSRTIRIICIVLPVLVGISRFFLGVHYPTDVITGLILGTIIVFIVPVLYERMTDKRILYLILIVCGLMGIFWCRSNDYFTGMGIMTGSFAGFVFEENVVKFKGTKKPLNCALRLLGGLVIFLALNMILKLPFSDEFLESATAGQYAVRAVRYAVITFVDLGVYPLAFGRIRKLAD